MPLPGFVVQEISGGFLGGPGDHGTVTLSKATAANNILLAFLRTFDGTSNPSVFDVAGNTWVPIFLNVVPTQGEPVGGNVSVWRAVAVSAAAGNQVSFNAPSSLNSSFFVMEVGAVYSGNLSVHTSGAAFTAYAAAPTATSSDGNNITVPLNSNGSGLDMFAISLLNPIVMVGFLIGSSAGQETSPTQVIDNGQFLSALVCSASANPQILLQGGNFQDALGRPLANGFLTAQLNQDSSVVPANVQLTAGRRVRIPLDETGSIAGTQFLWATDQMNFSTSAYIIKAFSVDGQLCWGPHKVTLPSTTPLFNVTQWIPNNIGGLS